MQKTEHVYLKAYFFPFLTNRGDKIVVIPADDVTKMVLTVPDGPTECDDEAKIDFETLMIDPIMGDIYLIQKNIFSTDASIYKVRK